MRILPYSAPKLDRKSDAEEKKSTGTTKGDKAKKPEKHKRWEKVKGNEKEEHSVLTSDRLRGGVIYNYGEISKKRGAASVLSVIFT